MKTYEDPSLSNRYSVRFDESRRVVEFLEADIIGPGFQNVGAVQLQPGQVVFVTHNQREMQARVIRHDYETQDVLLRINEVTLQTLKGRGGGIVVRVLAFYSDDLSSNPAADCRIFVYLKKTKIK